MIATRAGLIENVRTILKENVNVNAQDSLGLTALHHAIITNNKSIAKLLLKKGAKYNVKDKEGLKPIDYAHELRHSEYLNIFTNN